MSYSRDTDNYLTVADITQRLVAINQQLRSLRETLLSMELGFLLGGDDSPTLADENKVKADIEVLSGQFLLLEKKLVEVKDIEKVREQQNQEAIARQQAVLLDQQERLREQVFAAVVTTCDMFLEHLRPKLEVVSKKSKEDEVPTYLREKWVKVLAIKSSPSLEDMMLQIQNKAVRAVIVKHGKVLTNIFARDDSNSADFLKMLDMIRDDYMKTVDKLNHSTPRAQR